MTKYLIYYGIQKKGNHWSDHYYGTVSANSPQHAIQIASSWIPGIVEIDVRGIITKEIGNN